MIKKYEDETDYVLDVLEEAEDRLTEQLLNSLPQTIKFEFEKLLAIKNEIKRINA